MYQEGYRNTFLNLGIPHMVGTEPGEPAAITWPNGTSTTDWDRWELAIPLSARLSELLDAIVAQFGVRPNQINYGPKKKTLYQSFMPSHVSRLGKPLKKVLKDVKTGDTFCDLHCVVVKETTDPALAADEPAESADEDESMQPCPVIRLTFS